MPKLNWAITYLLMVVLCILGGTRSASAQPYYALEYWGGPVMETFTIYPLYYGDWSQADIDAQQAYLQSLTAYISGVNAPAGQQPTIRQYGVNSASLAAAATASPTATPATLTQSEVATIILANQLSGNLPPYSSTTLIAVFLAHGFQLAGCDRCSYHASNSNTQIWLAVPHDTGAPYQLATAHEVFEAATDPVVDDQTSWGWLTGGYYPPNSSSLVNDEMVDECGANTITLNNLGIQIPEVTDNTGGVFLGDPSKTQPPGGTCSTTGYTSLDEIQVYGWTLSDFEAKYASLRPQGWRLYILQSYVQPNGQLLYNAVWRPAGETDEKEQYAATLSQFETEYDTLHPLGWRLYILDSYVQDGSVRFNAVWRPSDLPEKDNYQDTAAQFQSQRTSLYGPTKVVP